MEEINYEKHRIISPVGGAVLLICYSFECKTFTQTEILRWLNVTDEVILSMETKCGFEYDPFD